jgi:hypothetical protein
MTRVEILKVTSLLGKQDGLTAHLDRPEPGALPTYAFEAAGWIVGMTLPATAVEFVHDDTVIATSELRLSRPDVAKRFHSASLARSGFWRAVGTVGLPPEFTVAVRAVLANGDRRVVAEIRGRQQLSTDFEPAMQPLMVSSLGRSGSTWLMRMLATHPQIVVHERHPYETRTCGYWMHFVRVLSQPVDRGLIPRPHDFFADPARLAHFPYYYPNPAQHADPPQQAAIDCWYGGPHVGELAKVGQRAVEDFYTAYARADGAPAPVYFAEKSEPTGQCAWLVRSLYPQAHEVFLVRDFRDVIASVLAFNQRRGFVDFGRERTDSDEGFVSIIRDEALALLRGWQRRPTNSILLRYEDLVGSTPEAVGRLLGFLGLDARPATIELLVRRGATMTAAVAGHRTSVDARSSIGRWRRDLAPGLQEVCREKLADVLDSFGYGPSASA